MIFVLGIATTARGIVTKGFYIDELSAIFLAIDIIGAPIGGSSTS